MPKPLDVRGVVAKYQDVKARSGGGNFIKLDKETNPLRLFTFINPESDREELYVEFLSHFLGKGAGGSVVCGKLTGDSCPICDYVDELMEAGEEEIAKSIKAKSRYYFNAIDGSGTAGVLECGAQVFTELTKYFSDPEFGNVADRTEGIIIKITKTGKGRDTKYGSIPSRKATPIEDDSIVGKNLYELVDVKSEDELKELLEKNFETIKKNAAKSAGGNAPPEAAEEEAPEGEEEKQARRTAEDSEPEHEGTKWKNKVFGKETPAKQEEEEVEEKQSDRVFGKKGKPAPKAAPAPKPAPKAAPAPAPKKGGVVFGKKR